MKTVFFKTALVLGICIAATGCGEKRKAAKAAAEAAEQARLDSIKRVEMLQKELDTKATIALLEDEPVFDIETSLGTIKVKLYKDTPKHRENFERLALNGFYDGLLFHRVINGFMIQGGDPLT